METAFTKKYSFLFSFSFLSLCHDVVVISKERGYDKLSNVSIQTVVMSLFFLYAHSAHCVNISKSFFFD